MSLLDHFLYMADVISRDRCERATYVLPAFHTVPQMMNKLVKRRAGFSAVLVLIAEPHISNYPLAKTDPHFCLYDESVTGVPSIISDRPRKVLS